MKKWMISWIVKSFEESGLLIKVVKKVDLRRYRSKKIDFLACY